MIAAVVMAIAARFSTVIGPHYLEDITNEIAKGIGGSIDMDAVRRLVIISVVILAAQLRVQLSAGAADGHCNPADLAEYPYRAEPED